MFDSWPTGCMCLRTGVNTAKHKTIHLFQLLGETFTILKTSLRFIGINFVEESIMSQCQKVWPGLEKWLNQ